MGRLFKVASHCMHLSSFPLAFAAPTFLFFFLSEWGGSFSVMDAYGGWEQAYDDHESQ
jgi:hypothetical protein